MPKKGKEERKVLWPKKDREELAARGRRPPSLVHHPSPAGKPSPTREVKKMLEEAERWVEEARWAGGCGKVAIIIANLTVGPDGCRGWAICFGVGASLEEAPTYHGRQSPLEGISPGWQSQEDQEVPAWHSCSLGDLAVPKQHWAPYQETPLLMVSLWDSPWSGQIWSALPREHNNMPAGSCRSIFGWSHGRCQPLHHTCKMGDNYAQRYSVSPPHLGRASPILKSSSKQANLLFVGCVGFFVCI